MARTCDYVNFFSNDQTQKCINTYGLREIYFRNPEYKSQDVTALLCNSHYLEVFGEWELKNQKLFRKFMNKKFNYFKDLAYAKKYAEYFNEYDFKMMNWNKVDDALIEWENHKWKTCCYDICEIKLESIKKPFQIIVDKPNGSFDKKLRTCSKEHWMKFIYQTGIIRPPDPKTKQKTIINLDTYT